MLSINQSKTLEEYWSKYKQYKRDLNTRMIVLKQNDFTKDARYNHLFQIVQAIEQVEASLDEVTKDFAEIRYLSDDAEYLDWDDVAAALGMTKPRTYNLRTKLIGLTAKKLGWIEPD